ncbi:CYTH domain-containing protein [Dolosicoccus paucivorans]|uniref:CYTH domain-containing protein n=1 Tax=Dolosicoccus paucivorans TaxID=84521 RepID=UPI00088FED26|nr:CYTH domain-containing protein [Dolosicoccus paucivorans]SDI22564.1 Uncharacterized protein YjbK [Dolosicoccus paucivorans]
MIETEAKVLLTLQQFTQLKQYFNVEDESFLYQENTYYDTVNSTLKDLRSAFRLRNFKTTSEWTLKQSLNQYDALEINQSNNQPIQPAPSTIEPQWIHLEALQSFFKDHHIDLSTLHKTYQIETYRYWIATPYGDIALDKSQYANITDYEMELEMTNLKEGLIFFNQLLEQFNIPNEPAPKKIARVAQATKRSI